LNRITASTSSNATFAPPTPPPTPPPPKVKILVVSKNVFHSTELDYINVNEDDILVVTDENPRKGYAFGYKKDNESIKGLFPKDYIKIFKNTNESMLNKYMID